MKQFSFLFLFINVLIFGQANVSYDASFGNNGRIFPLSTTTVSTTSHYKAVQNIDNKIIATSSDVSISRYNLNGDLDTTFGNSGTKIVSTSNNGYKIQDLAVLSDGSIIVLIHNYTYSYVQKYKQDGTLDTTFGSDGSLRLFITIYDNQFTRIKVLNDDSMLLGGRANAKDSDLYSDNPYSIGIIKIDKNGIYDTSFSLDGKVTISVPYSNYVFQSYTTIIGLEVDNSNSIYIGIQNYNNTKIANVIKLTPAGNTVTTFGTNGWASQVLTGECKDLKVFPNGKILIAANYYSTSNDIYLIAFKPEGTLDTSVGTGKYQFDIDNNSGDSVERILIIDNNTFYIVGSVSTGGIGYGLVLKFNSNFAMDSNFNYSGIYTTYNIINKNSSISDILLQKDKKLLLTGIGISNANNYSSYVGLTRLVDSKLLATNESIKVNSISIYPNPASGFINIQSEKALADKSFEIMDMTGKSVIKNRVSGKSINVSSLTTGNYILKIDNESYKFIKK